MQSTRNLYMVIFALIIVICFCQMARGDGLTVTTTADSPGIVPGQTLTVTTTFANTFAVLPPQTVEFSTSYQVGLLPAVESSSIVTMTKTRPLTIPAFTGALGSGFTLVAGSVKLDTNAITPTVAGGVMTIPMTKTLTEGQTSTLSFRLLCQ